MKDMVPIGKAAELLDISKDTLRNWEKKNIIKSYRTPTNRKLFKIENIEKIKQDILKS